MKIARNNRDLTQIISEFRSKTSESKIGFVPTMGALHKGHMSLIEKARAESDFVICSIFVNPTQFNEASDLEKYPRTERKDIQLLEENGCDLVFIPLESDIYPLKKVEYSIDLKGLDKVLEGKYRLGHFEGVCMVVERLFILVKPDLGFFGKKDFQQVSILRHMVKERQLPIKIIACPIKRNVNGLALSSRNSLLTDKQRLSASIISKTLFAGVGANVNGLAYESVLKIMKDTFNLEGLKLEYLEIIDNDSLQSVERIDSNTSVCIAAYCGAVRLIDNCQF